MKTNVQITAVKKEFKNGQNGYEVKVEGMDKRLDLNLQKGCYILKIGKVVRKVSVK